MAHDDAQLPILPLTDDELRQAGAELADMVRALTRMERDLADARTEQRQEIQALRLRIRELANTIRSQRRP
jgi:hypothetical protein